jgi:hypothetical protein
MRSFVLIPGLATSLALTPALKPAVAQPYYYPPSSYYETYTPPPGPTAYPYRHYYEHHYYHRYYGHYAYAGCGYRRHRAGAIGAVAGAFGGGIIGAAATHGNPAYTMVGAGLGALTGHLIGSNSHPYPC